MIHGPAAAANLERDGETRASRCSTPCDITRSAISTGTVPGARCTWRTFSSRAEDSRSAIERFSPRRCRTISTACFGRSFARDSSGRCTRATRFFRKPSRSGTPSDEAVAVLLAVRVGRRRVAAAVMFSGGESSESRGRAGAPPAAGPRAGRRAHPRSGVERNEDRAAWRGARRCCCAIADSTSCETGTICRARATRRSCSTVGSSGLGEPRRPDFRAGARRGARATAHATWISPSCSGRRGGRRPSRSTRSCPHAAAMSMPRLFRTATSTPRSREAPSRIRECGRRTSA